MNDDTQILRSCSALLNGELFVFGGYNQQTQVSTLNQLIGGTQSLFQNLTAI